MCLFNLSHTLILLFRILPFNYDIIESNKTCWLVVVVPSTSSGFWYGEEDSRPGQQCEMVQMVLCLPQSNSLWPTYWIMPIKISCREGEEGPVLQVNTSTSVLRSWCESCIGSLNWEYNHSLLYKWSHHRYLCQRKGWMLCAMSQNRLAVVCYHKPQKQSV